jgi:hypothetical protein
MVPTCALPPAIPLTDQVIAVFVVLETLAVSVVEAPSRTEVLAAMTLTLIGAGFAGVPEEVEPTKPHPDRTAQSITIRRDGDRERC